ncbi:family 16 glycoside hydrolase, partial [Nostoc sp. CHAB 5715]|uniref:family 16 glycoside hydrolase n=1 Tax=Nostoc sp. CHAB 5715 TaxID=2780400 RepID=UPI001E2AA18A
KAQKTKKEEWEQLFNGKDLTGWDIKIAGHDLNDNYKNTFRVEDGMIRLAYDQYEQFDGKFGHMYYHKPYSYYRLRFEYRFTGEQTKGVQTQPGETIVVIGDCPELGNWDINKAYPLEYINTNTWFAEIPFDESAGKLIAYKYAMWREGRSPLRENLVNRRWVIAKEGTVKWRDTWASGRES